MPPTLAAEWKFNMKNDFFVMGGIGYKSRLLHCFGEPNVSISNPKIASNLIKLSETDFITIYTHGDYISFKSIDDFPIGYFGIKFADIKKYLDVDKYTILINTNHALTPKEAIDKAVFGAVCTNCKMIKLEVLNDKGTKPINEAVFEAADELIKKGYQILPIIDKGDIDTAKKLERIGCLCIRVLMSDIGSDEGLTDPEFLQQLCKEVNIPIIAEGGLKTPQDAYTAVSLGASAVLVNAAIFRYKDPFKFIEVLKNSIVVGRDTYLCNLERKSRRESIDEYSA
ncbi:MAG: hypothetical protein FIA99_15775 [Ruminiclostridium sp.]|nr:hypothetical protein [Ruminiclostridium sp.]